MTNALRQNDVTKENLSQFDAFRTAWRTAGFATDSIGSDMQAVSSMVLASKSQGALDALNEFQRLKTGTGMDYTTIVQKYKENCELNERTRKQNEELLAERSQLSGEVAELKLAKAQQLKENGLTQERIDLDLKLRDRLKKAGFDVD